MLELVIPKQHYEFFDETSGEFLPPIDIKETKIQVEHSLISLKKWEQTWHKPFLDRNEKTYEELSDYIRCMTLNKGIDPNVYHWIPKEEIEKVIKYIEDPMTATWFKDNTLIGAQKNKRDVITAEIIYYWMISLNVPVEFERWHLNQLLTLIKVINIKNEKPKPVNREEAAKERAELNKRRRAEFNSRG